MIPFATPARFSVALTLIFGAFSPDAIAQLPLAWERIQTQDETTVRAGTLLIIDTVGAAPQSGKVLGNNGGTLLGDKETTAQPVIDQPRALTATVGALPSNFSTFIPVPTNIFYIPPNDADAFGGTLQASFLSKATTPQVYDANGDSGRIESYMEFEALPEPSTWCAAAFCAALICFQGCRQFRKNAWRMRLLQVPIPKDRKHARA
jgi:hypothetical protein